MTLDLIAPLKGRDLEEYGAARIRNEAFEQVCLLWERRKKDGWTQKQLAEKIGRDPGWVSRTLSAPGNWTLRTIGAFTQGLNGEADIKVVALEDAVDSPGNFDAYEDYVTRDVDDIRGKIISFDVTPLPPPVKIEAQQRAVQLSLGV
jgi:transcriptional regulator with XRE-family HTH domain